MADRVPAKIVMKGTAKMSLNDRFSRLSKKPPVPAQRQERERTMSRKDRFMHQRNLRLARQMESRPTVQAALRLKQRSQNVLQRLSARARIGGGVAMRGRFRGRGSDVNVRSRISFRGSPRGRGTRSFRGKREFFNARSPLRRNEGYESNMGGFRRGRGRGGRPSRGAMRGRERFNTRRTPRGARGGLRGRGRGQKPSVKAEDLDRELDEYMGQSKNDNDLYL